MNKEKYISFRVDDEQFDFIRTLAEASGLNSVSDLMRLALNEYVNKNMGVVF